MRVAVLTIASLAAFAGNSVLCRLALRDGAIDVGKHAASPDRQLPRLWHP